MGFRGVSNPLFLNLKTMKDTFYFSHDYNARSDEKIKKLIRKHQMMGYGIYWSIIEDLYNNANALQTDYEGIAFDLHTDPKIVKSILNDFELFDFTGEFFSSLSVKKRLELRDEKSSKARQSAQARWYKNKGIDANAKRTQSDGNAKKEKKGKEKKGNIIPPFDVFLEYAKANDSKISPMGVKHKYNAWLENDWRDGYDKPIKNWKSKLLNALKYIDKIKEETTWQQTGLLGNQ